MAAPVCNPSLGILFKYGTTVSGTTTYYDIGLLVALSGPQQKVESRDTSILTDLTNKKTSSIMDSGTVTGTVQYDPKSDPHSAMRTKFVARGTTKFRIVLPDTAATTIDFDAVINEWGSIKQNDRTKNLEADFTLDISGDVTFT